MAKTSIVRELLLPLQRRLGTQSKYGAIVDGRDIGTVVFPDADLKVFMTASLDVRAQRRFHQLESNGQTGSQEDFDAIKASIAKRDIQDSARGEAPLKQADDALTFDTSDMNSEEAIAALVELISTKLKL